MSQKKIGYIIANFGGPRNLEEIEPFLVSLLTDRDVIWTKFPNFLHNYLFKRIAQNRTEKVAHDYKLIGGKSPIFDDTESIKNALLKKFDTPILTFHRYLPETHQRFIEQVKKLSVEEIRVFPMFPQFTYATTGSIARWFKNNLPSQIVNQIRWVKSYPGHPSYIHAQQSIVQDFLNQNQLNEKDTILLFSAHGVPQDFVMQGDPYETECQISYSLVMKAFPKFLGRLAFQSKFGPGEWIKPYTNDVCEEITNWNEGRKNVVFVPLSFTSDHIETLFEIEQQYMTLVRNQGLNSFRVPALTLNQKWICAIAEILKENNLSTNQMLINN